MGVSHNKWQRVLRIKQELDFGKESPEVKERELRADPNINW